MKALIILSLGLNLALAGYVTVKVREPKPMAAIENAVQSKKPAPTSSFVARKTTEPNVETTVISNVRGSHFDWRMVESEDYRAYIANLRAIGCPEETIRNIITADVDKLYARKLTPFRKPPTEFKFWMTDRSWGGGYDQSDEFYKAQREGMKERRELLKQLLGIDYEREMAKQTGWNQKDPFEKLAPDVRDRAKELTEKFGEQQGDIYRKAKGHIDQTTQEELSKLRKQLHDDLAKILSPEELLDYEVRTSDLARNMKYNELQYFDATEAEFRAIFKAKQAAELAPGENRKAAQDELRETLGESRYKEYQRGQDYDYQNLVNLVDSRGLERTVIDQIEQMKADAQKAAGDIRRDKNLSTEQRDAALAAIRAETEKSVSNALGEKAFKTYKRHSGWMRGLAPPKPVVVPQ